MEDHFFFPDGRGNRLWGFLHLPDGQQKDTGFVMCNPFGEERVFAYRLLVNFARKLKDLGYPVMRFDYYGYGDSDGDFSEATVETRLQDIVTTVNYFKDKIKLEKIGLLGLRLGGDWALLSARLLKDMLYYIIAWEPLIDIEKYLKQALRMAITTQTVLFKKVGMTREQIIEKILKGEPAIYEGFRLDVIEGYPITKEFYIQAINVNHKEALKDFRGSILIVNIVKKGGVFNKDQEGLVNYLKEQGVDIEIVQAIEPVTFWESTLTHSYHPDQLFDKTVDWLNRKIKD